MRFPRRPSSSGPRRGAALLLSLLILLVLVAIVIQINVGTTTDARVARNDVGLTTMDLAIESSLLQVADQLKADAEADGGGGSGAPGEGAGGAGAGGLSGEGAPGAAPGAGAAGQAEATDSRKDTWAKPQRTQLNEIRLRILVQDEDSKINVLAMLHPDEKESQAARDRVVRCLDLCREGTAADIDPHTADLMARTMIEHMSRREQSGLPRPGLLSDALTGEEVGLPLSLQEFAVLAPFDESHFRDYRDADGRVVHSIGSFLTVWSSVATQGELARGASGTAAPGTAAPGTAPPTTAGGGAAQPPASGPGASTILSPSNVDTGGWAVNINTAPVAVLKALFDDRELHPRFWDRVIEYRNLEEEPPPGAPIPEEEPEPQLDEYGNEILDRKIFDSLQELGEVDGFAELAPEIQAALNRQLTTQSRVFSVFVVARRSTSAEMEDAYGFADAAAAREREERGDSLTRVVRAVFWRRKVDEAIGIVPLVRWEVIDYVPYEVLDFPDEKR